MYRIHWGWRLFAIFSFFLFFGILGYCTRQPRLNPDTIEDGGMTNAEKINQEIGREAFNRLHEKYGDQ